MKPDASDMIQPMVGPSLFEDNLLGALELENDLRSALTGVRLVAEIGLGVPLMTRLEEAIRSVLRVNGEEVLPARYPSLLVTYLVGEGLRAYGTNDKGNGLWDNLAIPQVQQRTAGPAFIQSLRKLGLPTFEEITKHEGARRYLTPILLHAGIPATSTVRFSERITAAVRDGFEGGDEIVAAFRRNERRIGDLPEPVKRFVRFGGDMVVDLVDRLLEAMRIIGEGRQPDPDFVGLPDDIVLALVASHDGAANKLGPRFPSPVVSLDPYMGIGPLLELPPAPEGLEQNVEEWIVEGAEAAQVRASALESRAISLRPPDRTGWHVEATAQDTSIRHWRFEVDRVIAFKADGRLSRNQSTVQSGDRLLCPSSFVVRERNSEGRVLSDGTRFAPLSGAWSAWSVHEVEPDGAHRIWVGPRSLALPGDRNRTGVEFDVVGGRLATWKINKVPGVVTSTGSEVIASPPCLDLRELDGIIANWTISSLDGAVETKVSGLPAAETGLVDLGGLVATDRITSLDLVARGPLGSDTHLRAMLIPGLEVVFPDRPLQPDEQAEILVGAEGLTINGDRDATSLSIPPEVSRATITVADDVGMSMELHLTVPRITWRVGDQPFGCHLTTIDLEEMAEATLAVRLGLNEEVALYAELPGQPPQFDGPVTTVGDQGIWAFKLAGFVDSIRLASTSRIRMHLKVGSSSVPALDVIARYEVSELKAVDTMVEDGVSLVDLRFTENRPFRDRQLELWSISRPWEGPHTVPVPDEARGNVLVEVASTPPGRYLTRLCVTDGWTKPLRPGRRDPGCVTIQIGNQQQLRDHVLALRGGSPLEEFERVLAEGGRLPDHLGPLVASEAIAVITGLLQSDAATALGEREFPASIEALFSDRSTAARAIAHSEVVHDASLALRFSIVTIPDALRSPAPQDVMTVPSRLWRRAPALAAALDSHDAVAWLEATGWSPTTAPDAPPDAKEVLPFTGHGLDNHMINLPASQLEDILDVLALNDTGALSDGGFILAMFELLENNAVHGSDHLVRWRSTHQRLNDFRCRTNDVAESFLDALEPLPGTQGWARLPQDLQAAAFHLVHIPDEQIAASRALLDASHFCPRLVTRALLVALVAFES